MEIEHTPPRTRMDFESVQHMEKTKSIFLGVALFMLPGLGFSHGDWLPLHGGLMSDAGEISYELVIAEKSLKVYVSDHGKPMPATGSHGTLTVARDKKEILSTDLTGSKEYLSTLKKPVLKTEDKVTVNISWPDGSSTVGRFSIANPSKSSAK